MGVKLTVLRVDGAFPRKAGGMLPIYLSRDGRVMNYSDACVRARFKSCQIYCIYYLLVPGAR